MFKGLLITTIVLSVAALAPAQQAQTTTDALTQLRVDYAKLKLEHDEAMAELRDLKAALLAETAADAEQPAETEPEAPRPQLTEDEAAALLQRIADHQAKLEAQVDTLIARQRALDEKVTASQTPAQPPAQPQPQAQPTTPPATQPTTQAYTQTIESPYAYRYERTDERIVTNPALQTDKPVIVSPKYTIYSNGYSTDSYVLPVEPARTVAAPVYVKNNYFYHGTVYPGHRTYYRNYYPHYPTTYYRHHRVYNPGGLTVGVVNGKTYFHYSTGGFYSSRRHCP